MRGLQQRVRLVVRVSAAVLWERQDLRSFVQPHTPGHRAVLVDVVPEVRHEIEVLPRHVIVRGEVPLLVMLARRDREAHPVAAASGGRCAQASDGAHRVHRCEAVEIPAIRLQPGDVDVNAVRQFRCRGRASRMDDAGELLVVGDFPGHARAQSRHTAFGLEWTWREPRPDHHGARGRVSGRNAE